MSDPKTPYRHTPRMSAIVPTNSIPDATKFFSRLGFKINYPSEPSSDDDYCILLHPNLSEVQLQKSVPGWLTEGKNPFGLYFYTPDVDKMAQEFKDEILGEGGKKGAGKPEHKPWKMYEFQVNGPDGTLVRIGWPSSEMTDEVLKQQEKEHT